MTQNDITAVRASLPLGQTPMPIFAWTTRVLQGTQGGGYHRPEGYSQEKLFINDITTSWVINRSGLNERKMGIEPFGAVLFEIHSRAHPHTHTYNKCVCVCVDVRGCAWMYPFISRIYLMGDGDRSAPRSWAQALVIAWELFGNPSNSIMKSSWNHEETSN